MMTIRNLKPPHVAASLFLLAAGSVIRSEGAFAQASASNDQAQEIQLLKQQMEVLNKARCADCQASSIGAKVGSGVRGDWGWRLKAVEVSAENLIVEVGNQQTTNHPP
jgi:hypothetical protein